MPAVVSFSCTSPVASVTFTHRPRPDQSERAWLQAIGKTTAGLPIAQTPRAKTQTIPVSWDNMPRANRDSLLAFFEAMNAMASLFTVTFSDGSTISARFAEPELTITEKSTDVFQTTVKLLVITP
ncbi:hypothetical protein FY034_12895 [Trichlorobacter lovleyi]|uniref:hypothetical protein n=1 Tax=Trichlorobacter lovleyi TaxID=313985 RepID=UPI002240BE7D|nr:hypothetical protein [Trichlorobacter lovleyi]QOX79789.1 hypothetical protein FY034_12895 [Trichlorobacter lovleyi]